MKVGDSWRIKAACRKLSPGQSDSIFFPGLGKKSSKAREFCSRNHCPVRDECIAYATLHKLEGNWGGTTRKERESFIGKLTARDTAKHSKFLDVT